MVYTVRKFEYSRSTIHCESLNFDYKSKLSPLWTYAGLAIVIAAAVLVESSLTTHEPFVTSTLSQAHYPDDLFEMPMTDDELAAYFDVDNGSKPRGERG